MTAFLGARAHGAGAELEPYAVLPCQFADGLFGGARLQPEKRLQLAVLEEAVLTFHRCVGVDRRRARRLLEEVDAWFASDDTSWPFAFVSICHSVRFDPDFIRRGLRPWRASRGAETDRRPPLRRTVNGVRQRVSVHRGHPSVPPVARAARA